MAKKRKTKKKSDIKKRVEEIKKEIALIKSLEERFIEERGEPRRVFCYPGGEMWVDKHGGGAKHYFDLAIEIDDLEKQLEKIYETNIPFERGTEEYKKKMSNLISKKYGELEDQAFTRIRRSPHYENWSDDPVVVRVDEDQRKTISDLYELLDAGKYKTLESRLGVKILE